MGGYPPLKMEQTVCTKMPAHKIQMPGNYPKKENKYFLNFPSPFNSSRIIGILKKDICQNNNLPESNL
jgi:hypothetical protein